MTAETQELISMYLQPNSDIKAVEMNEICTKIALEIDSKLVGTAFLGSIVTASTPTGTGKAFWLATQAGTYTNFGGVVVAANSFAVISRNEAVAFSISQTSLDISSKVNVSDVINTLTSTETTKPLSAAQGKVLNEKFIDYTRSIDLSYLDEIIKISKNLFNNKKILNNYWIGGSGELYEQGAGFTTSDYIPVKTGSYTLSGFYAMVAEYGYRYRILDYALNLVSFSELSTMTTVINIPSNGRYLQFAYERPATELNGLNAQLEKGSVATSYENYSIIVEDDAVLTTVLPSVLNVAVGRQCNIYKDNLSDVLADRDTLYSKDFTKITSDSEFLDLQRNSRYSPTSVKTLTANLKIENTKKDVQLAKNVTFNAVSKTAGTGTKNTLFIGDSLSAYGAISGEVKSLFDTDGGAVCNLIGRIGSGTNKYEARGGWSMSDYASNQRKRYYLTVTGFTAAIDMIGQYVVIGSTYYRIDKWSLDGSGNGTIELTLDSGSDTIPASGNFTYTGTGATTYAYIYTSNDLSGNPFWNINPSIWRGSAWLDFWTYMQNNHAGADLNVVVIQHGINDLYNASDDYVPTFKGYAQRLRDIIHLQYPDCQVIFSLEPFAPYSDGYSGLRGYVELDAYKKRMFKGYNALIELIDAKTTIAYSNLWIDRLYGYGAVTRNVNSRSSLQITENSGGVYDVHPSIEGSNQIADCIYSQIRAVL